MFLGLSREEKRVRVGRGEVRGLRTVEKVLDIQRNEWERQLSKEVREPDGQCRGISKGES